MSRSTVSTFQLFSRMDGFAARWQKDEDEDEEVYRRKEGRE